MLKKVISAVGQNDILDVSWYQALKRTQQCFCRIPTQTHKLNPTRGEITQIQTKGHFTM